MDAASMAVDQDLDKGQRRALVAQFWRTARGFWFDPKSWRVAWWMTIGLLVIVLVQVFVQYRLNVWNRELFDAIEKKNASGVLTQAMIFVPLAIAGVGLAMLAVYGRMRAQRRWRAWLNDHLIDRWFNNGRYYQLNLIPGDHENPEHRIAEDARIATDAPIDFAVGILGAFLTVVTFVGVLWGVGGAISFGLGGTTITIPGYLVIAVVLYALITSAAMIVIAQEFCSRRRGQKPGRSRIPLCADPAARERRKHRAAWRRGRGARRIAHSAAQGDHALGQSR